jgi:hypothetical protein
MENPKSEIGNSKQDRELHSCPFLVWNLNDWLLGFV